MKEADVGRRLLGSLLGAVAGVVVYWALLQAGIVLLAIVGAALSLGGGM